MSKILKISTKLADYTLEAHLSENGDGDKAFTVPRWNKKATEIIWDDWSYIVNFVE